MKPQSLFGHHIYRYQTEMLKDLSTLMSIPSVCAAPLPGKPFGENCSLALDCILSIARRLGLSTTNVDYYAGDAFYGTGSKYIDILTHIDVVPAGESWETPPFALVEKDGNLYGRGIADDKGAAIAALYGLKALQDSGIAGDYCIRTVFGCGEEIGSNDLDMYYEKRGFPVMGFTPDCHYGVCQSEKGILRLRCFAPHTKECVIRSFEAGTTANAVPAKANATLCCSLAQYDLLLAKTRRDSAFTLKKEGGAVYLAAKGTAAHGAEPELGDNAAAKLIALLASVFSTEELGPLFHFAADWLKLEYNGATLGIALNDAPSGPLTLNLGIVNADEHLDSIHLDIRYPVTSDKDFILSKITDAASLCHVTVQEESHTLPLYSSSDSLLVKTLSDSYEAVTDSPCTIYSTGGGTYARHSNNKAVAFGPVFEADPPSNAHGPNEFLPLKSYMRHAEICLESIYRLFLTV